MKALGILCFGLIILCFLLFCGYDSRGREISKLNSERENCINQIEGYKNAQTSAAKLKKELKKEVYIQTDTVDCFNMPLPDYVQRVFDKLK